MMTKKSACGVGMLLWILICFSVVEVLAAGPEGTYQAKVLLVEESLVETLTRQEITAVVSEGPYQGRQVQFNHMLIESSPFHIPLQQGMSIRLRIAADSEGRAEITFVDVVRQNHLKNLAVIFFILLLFLGRLKGLGAFVSLCFSFAAIVYCLIPLIMAGYDPVFSSILVSLLMTVISFVFISGLTKKSLCAIIGTMGGAISAGLFSYFYVKLTALTGLADEHVQLLVTEAQLNINYQGLLLCGMIIGSLGAVMDVSMSITSVIFELKAKHYRSSPFSLFASGITVGKDMMATMTNTLILAYAGSALPLFLVFLLMDLSFYDIINLQYVAAEIVRSLCGSIGLILTVPITALVAALTE